MVKGGSAMVIDLAVVRAHLRATVREKLLVAYPGYLPS